MPTFFISLFHLGNCIKNEISGFQFLTLVLRKEDEREKSQNEEKSVTRYSNPHSYVNCQNKPNTSCNFRRRRISHLFLRPFQLWTVHFTFHQTLYYLPLLFWLFVIYSQKYGKPNWSRTSKSKVSVQYFQKNSKFNFDFLDSSSTHHWEYTDMVLHLPLHCNICHTFLLTSKGKTKKKLFFEFSNIKIFIYF